MWNAFESKDMDFPERMFKAMVLSKDPNWRYEREKRILYSQANQLVMPNFEITSITFGLRMPAPQKSIIMKLLNEKNVTFYMTEKRKDSYDLKVVPYVA